MDRFPLPILVVVLLLLWATPTLANVAVIQVDPALVTAPVRQGPRGPPVRPVDLHVVGEDLSFDCVEVNEQPACDFRAVYRVKSRAQQRQLVVGAFLGIYTTKVTIQVSERDVSHVLTPDEIARIDDAVRIELERNGQQSLGYRLQHSAEALSRDGFKLIIEPEQELRIRVEGHVRPGKRFVPPHISSGAVLSRHPLLGTSMAAREYDLSYLVAPIRTWGSVGLIRVTMRHPASWEVELNVDGLNGKQDDRTRTERETNIVELTLNDSADLLHLHVTLPSPVFRNGGVLLGVGGKVGNSRGLRARLGYEVAAPGWLFHGITLDTDFSDDLVVTPTWEAATSGAPIAFIPSVALGLGAPVQIRPELTAGVRIQLTLQWLLIGLVASFDIYPGLDTSRPEFFQPAILAQVAL